MRPRRPSGRRDWGERPPYEVWVRLRQPAVPVEEWEGAWLMEWVGAARESGLVGGLEFFGHCPNGGHRSRSAAAEMAEQGVNAGHPDYYWPVPRGPYHGWYGELKRLDGQASDLSDDQKHWLLHLRESGYRADWHRGWLSLRDDLLAYAALPPARL